MCPTLFSFSFFRLHVGFWTCYFIFIFCHLHILHHSFSRVSFVFLPLKMRVLDIPIVCVKKTDLNYYIALVLWPFFVFYVCCCRLSVYCINDHLKTVFSEMRENQIQILNHSCCWTDIRLQLSFDSHLMSHNIFLFLKELDRGFALHTINIRLSFTSNII